MRLPIPPPSRLLQPDLTISRLDAILRFQPLQIGASLTMFWFARTTVPLLPRLNHSFGIESGIEIGVPLRAVSPNLPAPRFVAGSGLLLNERARPRARSLAGPRLFEISLVASLLDLFLFIILK